MEYKLSICIPTFKQAEKLRVLLNSIEIQTFRNFEVIVSDDSPDDEVENLCKGNYLFEINYFRNPVAKGSPENWNAVVKLARGEWVKLIHHDDYFYSEHSLQEFVNASILNPEIDYFFSATSILDSKSGKQFPYIVNLSHVNRIDAISALLFHKNLIGAPSTGFYRKTLSIQYDTALIWLVDIEYYIRLLATHKVKYIDKPLITTVISEGQLTTGFKNNRALEIREFLYCYSKYIRSFDLQNKKILRKRLLDLFSEFDVKDVADLRSLGLISPIPFFAKVLLFFCKINRQYSFRLLYRLNHFKL
jgi:glycosyltransferase involved in cell wall biosynthesis